MLSALAFGWAIIYANRTCLYPLLSVIADQLGLTSAQAGALTSAYFTLYVLMQVPAGILGDRFGLKQVMLVMYCLAGFGILGLGLWGDSYALLLLFAALHGLGAGAYYPAAYGTVLQVVEPARRGFSSAVIGIGMAVGLMLGLAISGPVYEIMGSYRAPFLLLAVPTFAMLVYFQLAIPQVRGAKQSSWREYKAILTDRDLWCINFATFAALYGFWVAISWGPTFLKVERSFSLGQAGFYTGLVALTAVPAGLIWGKLSDRFGRKHIALAVLPAAAVCLYLLSVAQQTWAIIAALLFFGMFSNSAFAPVMVAWTGDIVSLRYPGYSGAAIGIFNCVIMCSAIVAPLLSGMLRDLTGSLAPAMAAGSIIMLAGTAFLIILPATAGQKQETVQSAGEGK